MVSQIFLSRKLKLTNDRIILIWLLLLLMSPIAINSIDGESNSQNEIDFRNPQFVSSHIELNQVSDPFQNPVNLNFNQDNPTDNFQRASFIGSVERVKPQSFKFFANEGQNIDVEINLTQSVTGVNIAVDIYSGDNLEYIDSFHPPIIGEFPFGFFYSIPFSGSQYLVINLLGEKSQVDFGLTVLRTESGEFGKGIDTVSQKFQSNSYGKINNLFEYLVNDSEYISNDGLFSLNLGDFNASSSSVAKGVASAIFGLLRAGELVASESVNGEALDPVILNEKFSPYFEISVKLLEMLTTNLKHSTQGLFFEDFLSSDPNYVFYLETNVYMIMAMLEVWNFYQHAEYGTEDLVKSGELLKMINDTIIDINNVFYNPAFSGYAEITIITANDFANPTFGDKVQLESTALLGEVAAGAAGANTDGGSAISPELNKAINIDIIANVTNYIQTNLLVDSIDGQIGAEFYDHNLGAQSNSTSLISNTFLISLLTSPVIFDIQLASEIAESAISHFLSPNNGLLYDSVHLNDSSTSESTSLINTGFFLTSLDRLAEKWKFETFVGSALDISRTWSKAVRDLQNIMNSILFDEQTNSYFAQYKHKANLSIKNNDNILTNDFVANTVIQDLLSKTFPVKVVLTAPKTFVVENDATIIVNIQQIDPIRKSWLWFQPERNYTIEAQITIPKHGVDEIEDIDLSTFDFESGFIDIIFTPIVRGNFKANIELTVEGDTLLEGNIDLVTFGRLYLDWAQSDFYTTTDKSEFEPTISIFDNTGRAVSNLEIKAVLGDLGKIIGDENHNFTISARTDTSGKANLEFSIDGLQYQFPEFAREARPILEIPIFVNVTNAHALKYESSIFQLGMTLEKNFLEVRTSPQDPEIIVTGKTLLQSFSYDSKLTPITIQVTTQDIFGKSVSADYVSMDWAENVDTEVIIFSETTTVPATFSIDPTDLDAGSYEIEIKVQKEGFTKDDNEYISILKLLTIEEPSLIDSAAAAVFVFGGLIAGKILGFVYSFTRSKTQKNLDCPNCGKTTTSTENACQYCGNVLPGKTLSTSILDKISPIGEKVMDLRGEKDSKEDLIASQKDQEQTKIDDDIPPKDID